MRDIVTERLRLRELAPSDFEAVKAIYSRPEVARMVASWPIPPDDNLIRKRCKPQPDLEGMICTIEHEGKIVGTIGAMREDDHTFELGYGIHPDHWGRGFASEASCAIIDATFAGYDCARMLAGTWDDNPGSGRVLEKLGFRYTHNGLGWCMGRSEHLTARMYEMTRAEWLAANPLSLETERLVIRRFFFYFLGALNRIFEDADAASHIDGIEHPSGMETTTSWAVRNNYRGRPDFSAGVFSKTGTLLGVVGLTSGGPQTSFFFGREHWGNGYSEEALSAFLRWCFGRFALDMVEAKHLAHDHDAARVLEKLGFVMAGDDKRESPARLEPAAQVLYRLAREDVKGLAT